MVGNVFRLFMLSQEITHAARLQHAEQHTSHEYAASLNLNSVTPNYNYSNSLKHVMDSKFDPVNGVF